MGNLFSDDHDPNSLHAMIDREALTPELLATYMSAGNDIHLRDKNGDVPLIKIVKRRELALARVMVQYGAQIDVADRQGATALHWACTHLKIDNKERNKKLNGQDLVELFLQHSPLSIRLRDERNNTPLDNAIETDNVPVLRFILLQSLVRHKVLFGPAMDWKTLKKPLKRSNRKSTKHVVQMLTGKFEIRCEMTSVNDSKRKMRLASRTLKVTKDGLVILRKGGLFKKARRTFFPWTPEFDLILPAKGQPDQNGRSHDPLLKLRISDVLTLQISTIATRDLKATLVALISTSCPSFSTKQNLTDLKRALENVELKSFQLVKETLINTGDVYLVQCFQVVGRLNAQIRAGEAKLRVGEGDLTVQRQAVEHASQHVELLKGYEAEIRQILASLGAQRSSAFDGQQQVNVTATTNGRSLEQKKPLAADAPPQYHDIMQQNQVQLPPAQNPYFEQAAVREQKRKLPVASMVARPVNPVVSAPPPAVNPAALVRDDPVPPSIAVVASQPISVPVPAVKELQQQDNAPEFDELAQLRAMIAASNAEKEQLKAALAASRQQQSIVLPPPMYVAPSMRDPAHAVSPPNYYPQIIITPSPSASPQVSPRLSPRQNDDAVPAYDEAILSDEDLDVAEPGMEPEPVLSEEQPLPPIGIAVESKLTVSVPVSAEPVSAEPVSAEPEPEPEPEPVALEEDSDEEEVEVAPVKPVIKRKKRKVKKPQVVVV